MVSFSPSGLFWRWAISACAADFGRFGSRSFDFASGTVADREVMSVCFWSCRWEAGVSRKAPVTCGV